MQNESSKRGRAEVPTQSDTGSTIEVAVPVRDPALFKHGATNHVLNFLSDNPDFELSIRQLSNVVPYTERSVRESVNVLETNELVTTNNEGNARHVRINRERLRKADDPILSIPQTEFQLPSRIAKLTLEEELEELRGIIVFGSVARGEADRRSDIDLWVLVGADATVQQHEANKIADDLSSLQIPPAVAVFDAVDADVEDDRRSIKEVLVEDEQNWSSAQRYDFEIIVESPTSFLNKLERVDHHLFTEGITLVDSEALRRLKQEVLERE